MADIEPSMGYNVIVTGVNGEILCEVHAQLEFTVKKLKQEIEVALHIPAAEQQLSHSDGLLRDGDLLLKILETGFSVDLFQGATSPLTVMLAVVKARWTDQEIETARMKLERSVRHQQVDDVEAVLSNMPFYDEERATVLGLQREGGTVLIIAVGMQHWHIVKMIMEEVTSLAPDLQEWIVLPAVQQNGRVLEFASEEMRSNKTIVLAAFHKMGYKFESEEMINTGTIFLAVVQQDGLTLQFGPEEIKHDESVVLAAVQQNGLALGYASEGVKGAKIIVLAAVQEHYYALQHASADLRDDATIVLAAVECEHGKFPEELATKSLSYASNRVASIECVRKAAGF
jgi:hypothetical protein